MIFSDCPSLLSIVSQQHLIEIMSLNDVRLDFDQLVQYVYSPPASESRFFLNFFSTFRSTFFVVRLQIPNRHFIYLFRVQYHGIVFDIIIRRVNSVSLLFFAPCSSVDVNELSVRLTGAWGLDWFRCIFWNSVRLSCVISWHRVSRFIYPFFMERAFVISYHYPDHVSYRSFFFVWWDEVMNKFTTVGDTEDKLSQSSKSRMTVKSWLLL